MEYKMTRVERNFYSVDQGTRVTDRHYHLFLLKELFIIVMDRPIEEDLHIYMMSLLIFNSRGLSH